MLEVQEEVMIGRSQVRQETCLQYLTCDDQHGQRAPVGGRGVGEGRDNYSITRSSGQERLHGGLQSLESQ